MLYYQHSIMVARAQELLSELELGAGKKEALAALKKVNQGPVSLGSASCLITSVFACG